MKTMLHWDARNFWELWLIAEKTEFVPLSCSMAIEIAQQHGIQIPEKPKKAFSVELPE